MNPARVTALLQRQQGIATLEDGQLHSSPLGKEGSSHRKAGEATADNCNTLWRLLKFGWHLSRLDERPRKIQGPDLLAKDGNACIEGTDDEQRELHHLASI